MPYRGSRSSALTVSGHLRDRTVTNPSVLEALDWLAAIQAAWKPSPDRHSIWQIVDHLAKSKEWERAIIEGVRRAWVLAPRRH